MSKNFTSSTRLILCACFMGATVNATATPFSNLVSKFSFCVATGASVLNTQLFNDYVNEDTKVKQAIEVENKPISELMLYEMKSDRSEVMAYNGDSVMDGNKGWTEFERSWWKDKIFHSDKEIMRLSDIGGKNPTIANYHRAARHLFNSLHLGSPIMNNFLAAHPEFEDKLVTRENLQLLTDAENKWIMSHKNDIKTYGDMLAYMVPQETIDARLVVATLAAQATFYYQNHNIQGLTMDEEFDKYILEVIPSQRCPF